MKDVIQQLIGVLDRRVRTVETLHVTIGSPCQETQLGALEKRINWRLPESYGAFLRCVNGIKLHNDVESELIDLFAVEMLPLPIDANQRQTLAEDGVDLASILIIGGVPMHSSYVYLDRMTGETVHWIQFESTRFATFDEYLKALIEDLKQAFGAT